MDELQRQFESTLLGVQYSKERVKTRDLLHQQMFGDKPIPPTCRVLKNKYPRVPKPFKSPATIPWEMRVPASAVPIFLNGSASPDMQQKFFIYAEGPDAEGKARINMHHNWTMEKIVELNLSIPLHLDSDGVGSKEATITSLTWETTMDWDVAGQEVMMTRAVPGTLNDITREDGYDRLGYGLAPGTALIWEVDRKHWVPYTQKTQEEVARYITLEACQFVLGIKLVEKVPEPWFWSVMPEYTYGRIPREDISLYKGTGGHEHESKRRVGDRMKMM